MLFTILSSSFALLVAGIFLTAGVSKWRAENQIFYQQAIEAYDITPASWAASLVKALAFTEIGIAILAAIPFTQKFGLLSAVIMLCVYMYLFAMQLNQGKADMACGCAGPASELKVSSALLIRNALLASMCFAAIATPVRALEFAWFFVLPTAALLGLFYLCCEQLIDNHQKIQALRLSVL